MSAIVIDTSALMGLLLQESDAEALLDAAARAAVVRLSAASRLELALLALRGEVMPFDQHQRHWALEGWRRYGKGRHPAVPGRRLRGHRCAPRPWSRERSRGALRARKDAAHHRA